MYLVCANLTKLVLMGNMNFLFDMYCFKSYSEDGDEYWSEGCAYEAAHDEHFWYIKTNFGGIGVVGAGRMIEDVDEFFIYLS